MLITFFCASAKTVSKMNFWILFLFLGAAIALAEIHEENDPKQYKPHRAIFVSLNSLLYVFHLQLFLFGAYCGEPMLLFDYLTPWDLVDRASTRLVFRRSWTRFLSGIQIFCLSDARVMLISSFFIFHYRAQNSPSLFTYHHSRWIRQCWSQ